MSSEGETRKAIAVRMLPQHQEMWDRIAKYAKKDDRSKTNYITNVLMAHDAGMQVGVDSRRVVEWAMENQAADDDDEYEYDEDDDEDEDESESEDDDESVAKPKKKKKYSWQR